MDCLKTDLKLRQCICLVDTTLFLVRDDLWVTRVECSLSIISGTLTVRRSFC